MTRQLHADIGTTAFAAQPPMHAAPSAQERISAWLLGRNVQQVDGGVAGWVDAKGQAAYVYPEITGYYLQWLAWRASGSVAHAFLARRADAAQQWLKRWLGGAGAPLTRIHSTPGIDDWRNRAVFAFDVAMVLRGLAAAARMNLVSADPAVVKRLNDELERLVAHDGQLDACSVHADGADFPRRWSTQRGPFLAKAAAGIEVASASLPGVSTALRTAAAATFDASIEALTAAPHAETHPQLYALEGYLAWPGHPQFAARLPAMMTAFEGLVASTLAQGRVPESQREAGTARLDIVAQMLRVGVLLGHHGGSTVLASLTRPLVAALETAVLPDGAMPFARHGDFALQRNAWVAMFATQALAWKAAQPSTLRHVAKAPAIV